MTNTAYHLGASATAAVLRDAPSPLLRMSGVYFPLLILRSAAQRRVSKDGGI